MTKLRRFVNAIADAIEIARAVAKMAPVVLGLMRAAQDQLGVSGKGAQRLAMVRGWLEDLVVEPAGGLVEFAAEWDQLWPHLERFIARTVDRLKALGEFVTTSLGDEDIEEQLENLFEKPIFVPMVGDES